MHGIHLISEFYGCDGHSPYLCDAGVLKELCVSMVEEAGLTVLDSRFHQFQPSGSTGVVVLAESHLAIHTWPENGYVTLDVFVCNYAMDNTDKAHWLYRELEKALMPREKNLTILKRGP